MIPVLASIASFFILFSLETGFFASLPGLISTIPLVFIVSVYLIQHEGRQDGVWWMIGYGFLLQAFHLRPGIGTFVGFALAAIVCRQSARHLFSNRSLYGVVACTLAGAISFTIVDAGLLWFTTFSASEQPDWATWWHFTGSQMGVIVVGAILLFLGLHKLRAYVRP